MSPPTYLYVGCYTTASPFGIHVFEVADGDLSARARVEEEQASFLAVRSETATLYVVRETDEGALVALRISPDGSLTRIDEVSSHGSAPCHVSVDADHAYVANYVSGTVAAYRLQPDGRFGPLLGHHRHEGSGPHPRQAAPHAHCIVPSPSGAAIHATDLGTDRIVRYSLDPAADAERFRPDGEIAMRPGSGPRHLAYHPTEPVAFALCELDCTLVVLDVDPATGHLHPRTAVSTLPADAGDVSIGAEVCVHPDGRRVFVSNRGHDSIATFAFDAPDATPTLLGHVPSGGRTPRHFTIDPTGRLLLAANQDSGTIVSFALDDPSGIPREIGIVAELSQPVCLTFAEVTR